MHEKIADITSFTQQSQISETKLNYANLRRQNAVAGKAVSAHDASMRGQLVSTINSVNSAPLQLSRREEILVGEN